MLRSLHHLALITSDMTGTTRFYRDLLGMKLAAGIGHDGYRHYFFRYGEGDGEHIAFFEYKEAGTRDRKFHGERTENALGFDHVALRVKTVDDLYAMKDKLEAADVKVTGPIDHGNIWSIYFFDPNNIPLEAAWDIMDIVKMPGIVDDDPLDIAAEGADPQPGHFPEPARRTPRSEYGAKGGNGEPMRRELLENGRGKLTADYVALMAEISGKKDKK